MIKIMFVCHGNICRSPMAEFVLKDMVAKQGLSAQFVIASSATSTEEIGSSVHKGTQAKLAQVGISCAGKRAIQLTKGDYDTYDYLIVMDSMNLRNLKKIIGEDTLKKVFLLLDFTDRSGDIADPWYSGNFDATYSDVVKGCKGFLAFLAREKRITID